MREFATEVDDQPMPDPGQHEAAPDRASGVDEVIQEARASSWQLPDAQAAQPPPGAPNASPGARWAPPRPTSTAVHAEPAHVAPAHPGPARAADAGPVHAAPTSHAGADGQGPSAGGAASAGHGSAHDSGPDSGHDSGHTEEPLGPVDVEMWGAGVLATAIGLLMAVGFVLATSGGGAF
jgi:hypothetical protein